MIHAGLPPQWDLATARSCARELEQALRDDARCLELFSHMYGDRPNRWSDDLRGVDRLRFITNCLTRLRFCRADGTLELKFKGKIDERAAGSACRGSASRSGARAICASSAVTGQRWVTTTAMAC